MFLSGDLIMRPIWIELQLNQGEPRGEIANGRFDPNIFPLYHEQFGETSLTFREIIPEPLKIALPSFHLAEYQPLDPKERQDWEKEILIWSALISEKGSMHRPI
jgi:hypothetical protein